MKEIIVVAVVCLSLPFRGLAQSPGEKVELELGNVTVWLGVPQQEALSKFATAGYRVHPASGSDDLTVVLNGNGEHVYNVKFSEGRLTLADRSWMGKGVNNIEAVIGALGALAQHGSVRCEVIHDPIAEPGSSWDRIFVSCGKRSVLIAKGKVNNIGSEIVEVSERIRE